MGNCSNLSSLNIFFERISAATAAAAAAAATAAAAAAAAAAVIFKSPAQ